MAFFQGVKEPQKPLVEIGKGANQQGTEVAEDEDRDQEEDDGEDTEQEPGAVEAEQRAIAEENAFPLLNREDLRRFDIPIVFNDAVDYFIRTFTVEKRKVFTTWLKRAKRYAPTIREILRKEGLPEDLVYLAMIESGFNPKAYSPMKACGPWQFIYETGERYGLRVNYWMDERRDPQKSTVAAARYLKDLFNQFGCWYLAAAGYNAGERRVERAIAKHETNDFWELRKFNTLPRETREYIPQLIAAAIIAKDPEKYGITNIPFDAPVSSVVHKVPGGTPLAAIAKAARSDMVTVRLLNPELLRGITPPGTESYDLRLPETVTKDEFGERLKALLKDGCRVSGVTAYTVKRRDSILRITRRYGISRDDIMLVNACGAHFRLTPGAVVYIPDFEREGERKMVEREQRREETERKPAAAVAGRVGEKPGASSDYHIVTRGEGLPGIARRYGLDVRTLREINSLRSDKVRPGTRLALAGGKSRAPAYRRDEADEPSSQKRIFHVVKKGESLADISGKYGASVATLKKLNKLTGDRIIPNMRLEVADRLRTQPAPEKAAQASTVQARPAKFYHVVKKGECLTEISEKYSTDVSSLKRINGLKKDGLRPGMRLRVAIR